jgi:hypothetical protein
VVALEAGDRLIYVSSPRDREGDPPPG